MKRLLLDVLILLLIASPATARTGTWSADDLWDRITYPYKEQVKVMVWVLPENARAFAISNHREMVVLKESIPPEIRADVLAHELGHILHFRADVDWAAYRDLRGMADTEPLTEQREDFAESFRVCFGPSTYPHRYRRQWGEPGPAACNWLTGIETRVRLQAD